MEKETHKPEVAHAKKAYAAPTVQKVQLRPEEAVLGFCKGPSAGPIAARCKNVVKCSVMGS